MQEESHTHSGISLHAGFPNAATDTSLDTLNLNQLLITNPTSTFLFRIEGDAWESFGIFDKDIALVNRALTPQTHDIVIWWKEGTEGFSLSRSNALTKNAIIWGVVSSIIHQFRKDAL